MPSMLRIVLTALGVVKAAVQWFREQSPDDVAARAARDYGAPRSPRRAKKRRPLK